VTAVVRTVGEIATSTATLDMLAACEHADRMSRMVQIRHVPDALHRALKIRALNAGQSLSDYLLAELERLAARPTREEMLARLSRRKRVTLRTPAAVVIRDERESA
jgi:antitoxin FitA